MKILTYLADNLNSNVNINQLSRLVGISVGSSHLILKEFEKDGIVISEPVGNSIMYKLNFANMKAQKLLDEIKSGQPEEYLKKTKIVATIGPSTNDVAMIRKMIVKGMNIARIDSSHHTKENILQIIKNIRKADPHIPILLDILGIKIRSIPTDRKLIKFAIKNKVNFLGVSFIKTPEQVEQINKLIDGTGIKLISKIGTKEAIENYHKIIEKLYGVMIDGEDLGAEIGLEKIPRMQKKIIEECNYQGKPIIVATQMLDSMRNNLNPTKSEISDVANAVLDGASAVMLSAETAVGKYPLEAISTMSSIISDIENEVSHRTFDDNIKMDNFTDVIGAAIAQITNKIKIDKIICMTYGGFSARMLARHKLSTTIIAATNNPDVYSIMNLMWGVRPLLVNTDIDNSASVEQKRKIMRECLENGLIRKDDTILLTGAVFPNNRKITNMIEVHKVNEFLGYFEEVKND